MSEKKSLAAKLAEVMGAIKTVAKRGKNTFHGYDYATETDLVNAIRGLLVERSIILVPDVEGYEVKDMPDTSKGKKQFLTSLQVKWTFMDGDSDAQISFHIPGFGIDGEDKGGYKALTGSEKYALMKFFLVSTGDDPERESGKPAKLTQDICRECGKDMTAQAVIAAKKLHEGRVVCATCRPVAQPATLQQARNPTPKLISQAQLSRLFAICKQHDTAGQVKEYILKQYGYKSSAEIEMKNYEAICAWAAGESTPTDLERSLTDSLHAVEQRTGPVMP